MKSKLLLLVLTSYFLTSAFADSEIEAVMDMECSNSTRKVRLTIDTNTLIAKLTRDELQIRTPVRETENKTQQWKQYVAAEIFSIKFMKNLAPILHWDADYTCQ